MPNSNTYPIGTKSTYLLLSLDQMFQLIQIQCKMKSGSKNITFVLVEESIAGTVILLMPLFMKLLQPK